MELKEKPNQDIYDEWQSDPLNWKLGIFYFNPKDKRIFPPKRFKSLGWTVNFANPLSVLALLLIILLVGLYINFSIQLGN